MAASIESATPSSETVSGAAQQEILTDAARAFLTDLHHRFDDRRLALLKAREERQKRFDAGELPDFLADTATIRDSDWRVAPIPAAIQDRRVEITGQVDRKMIINALNSGAKVFMADFEDSTTPTWSNLLDGQINLRALAERGESICVGRVAAKDKSTPPLADQESAIAPMLVRQAARSPVIDLD